MPWKENRILDQRLQFLSNYQKEEMSVADLCRAYGISRPTAYRWINRHNETGPEGLVDRRRRPHTSSHATLEPVEKYPGERLGAVNLTNSSGTVLATALIRSTGTGPLAWNVSMRKDHLLCQQMVEDVLQPPSITRHRHLGTLNR
jgi:transposase-like protein